MSEPQAKASRASKASKRSKAPKKSKASKKSKATKGGDLLTLTDVSKHTGISMPTLQKYKKKFADRIPSKGKGRTQRYPEEALPVFEEIRKESSARRGRPPKAKGAARKPARSRSARQKKSTRKPASAARSRARAAKAPAAEEAGMLSLTEISKRTGISYPTLMRYVRSDLGSIPHQGEGRKRRYPPEAVEAFQKLYARPRGGARPAAAKAKRSAKAAKSRARAVKSAAPAKAVKAKKAGRTAKAATRRTAAAARRGTRRPATDSEVTRVLQRLEGRLTALEKELKKPIKVEIRR